MLEGFQQTAWYPYEVSHQHEFSIQPAQGNIPYMPKVPDDWKQQVSKLSRETKPIYRNLQTIIVTP